MSSDLAIRVENISKAYQLYEHPLDRLKQMLWGDRRKFHDEFWALRNINFEVKKGETVGIVGRNGSGKSTLLQIICGTVTPTLGTVERNGRISALLELGSGFDPEFTGRENVFLYGSIIGMTQAEMEARFDKIAAFADIGNFIDSPVKHYSSGMFARLAFAVAIHVDPEILIVDEILAVGDAAFQRKCLNRFYEIREGGCSILFVSHDQYQVKSICQRAIYIDDGHQKMFGAAGEVIDQYMIDLEERIARSTTVLQAPSSAMDNITSSPITAHTNGLTTEAVNDITDANALTPDRLFRIKNIRLTDDNSQVLETVQTGQTVRLTFDFEALVDQLPKNISFVFNLYRHDDLYLCGTTTAMDGIKPYPASKSGSVSVDFSEFPLLSGQYKWRVAINDGGGFITYAEAKGVCTFRVQDNFKAVGMFNLCRTWRFEPHY